MPLWHLLKLSWASSRHCVHRLPARVILLHWVNVPHAVRARNDRANAAKRQQRLRGAVAGYHVDLAKNDAAILWMDQWLVDEGCDYRSAAWIERSIQAWSNHMADLSLWRR